MTYNVLAAQTTSDSNFSVHDLTPVGTDEDEFKRYQQQYGQELDPDDDADLREYVIS